MPAPGDLSDEHHAYVVRRVTQFVQAAADAVDRLAAEMSTADPSVDAEGVAAVAWIELAARLAAGGYLGAARRGGGGVWVGAVGTRLSQLVQSMGGRLRVTIAEVEPPGAAGGPGA